MPIKQYGPNKDCEEYLEWCDTHGSDYYETYGDNGQGVVIGLLVFFLVVHILAVIAKLFSII